MNITLQNITRDNYEAVCDLDVAEDQLDYVACNMWSLVESHYNQGYTCKAIYRDEEVVGFFMWVQESESKISIWRFMVGEPYQKQGIGRVALELALSEIKALPAINTIEICYDPNNPVAKDFYTSFGFIEQGMDDEGDDMLAQIKL